MLAAAWATGRAPQSRWVKVSSAVAMVLPEGVFITTTPRSVAASTSMLSTPTPARPTTLSRGAAASISRVILVSERTAMACTSPTKASNLLGGGAVSLDHFKAGLLAQVGHAFGRDLIGNKDFHRRQGAAERTRGGASSARKSWGGLRTVQFKVRSGRAGRFAVRDEPPIRSIVVRAKTRRAEVYHHRWTRINTNQSGAGDLFISLSKCGLKDFMIGYSWLRESFRCDRPGVSHMASLSSVCITPRRTWF
jgi:hypothetical protein